MEAQAQAVALHCLVAVAQARRAIGAVYGQLDQDKTLWSQPAWQEIARALHDAARERCVPLLASLADEMPPHIQPAVGELRDRLLATCEAATLAVGSDDHAVCAGAVVASRRFDEQLVFVGGLVGGI